jgi:hypothetical protein
MVCPNPAKNLIEIKTDQANSELVQIEIYDAQGRLIMSKQHSIQKGQTTVEISSIPSQLLFIKLTDKGGKHQMIKFLKE